MITAMKHSNNNCSLFLVAVNKAFWANSNLLSRLSSFSHVSDMQLDWSTTPPCAMSTFCLWMHHYFFFSMLFFLFKLLLIT